MAQKTQSADSKLALVVHRAKGVQYLNMASAFEGSGNLALAQITGARISSPAKDVSDSPIESSVNEPEVESESEAESESKPEGETEAKPEVKPEPSTKPIPHHHAHKLFGTTSLHGVLLAVSFFALSIGTLGIRSGIMKSFRLHWIVQAVGGTGIVIGCLLGIWISYAVSIQSNRCSGSFG